MSPRRTEAEPRQRRCIVSGEVGPRATRLRFVLDPEGAVVPDVAGRLPGRGVWVCANREAVAQAVRKSAFSRAARRPAKADPALPDQIETLLVRRCVDLIGLSRRAGSAVAGHDKVREWIDRGRVGVLVQAADGSRDGRAKLARAARGARLVEDLSSAELSLAFGRENVIHAALAAGRLADRFCAEAARLRGFRGAPPGGDADGEAASGDALAFQD